LVPQSLCRVPTQDQASVTVQVLRGSLHDVMRVSIKAEFVYIFAEATAIIGNLAVPFCCLP
jgi:hypothetical protein